MSAPGSFRERMQVLRALAAIRKEEVDWVEGQLMLDEILLDRLETDDGTDLDDALDKLSANDANELLSGLLATRVPTESAEN
jgi:hypothetical protein